MRKIMNHLKNNKIMSLLGLIAIVSVLVMGLDKSDLLNRNSLPIKKDIIGGHFEYPEPMLYPRMWHTATLLDDGRVLVIGGVHENKYIAETEFYNPKTKRFKKGPKLHFPRGKHEVVKLNDGRVLVIGGYNLDEEKDYLEIEAYIPSVNSFKLIDKLQLNRYGHTVTLLRNNEILIIGGGSGKKGTHKNAELYNVTTKTIKIIPTLEKRDDHTATLLQDGRVLIVGGSVGQYSNTAEIYDPKTQSFAYTGSMKYPRGYHSAVLLPNGNVLVVGGRGAHPRGHTTAELYNPLLNKFESLIELNAYHNNSPAVLLNNNLLLIYSYKNKKVIWQIYDSKLKSLKILNTVQITPAYKKTTHLSDNQILFTGIKAASKINSLIYKYKNRGEN